MGFKEDFEKGLKKYVVLEILWIAALVLLLASNYFLAASYLLGATFFFLGALDLAAAGIGCAYVIARDT